MGMAFRIYKLASYPPRLVVIHKPHDLHDEEFHFISKLQDE